MSVIVAGVVQGSVIVEVFLHIDQCIALDPATDDRRVDVRITAREGLQQSGDVITQRGKSAAVGRRRQTGSQSETAGQQQRELPVRNLHVVAFLCDVDSGTNR